MNDGTTRLGLSRHAALKRRRAGDVLVLPERAIRLGGSGGEILRLLERPRSREEIVAILRDRYAGDAAVDGEVGAFLDQMRSIGAIADTTASATAEADSTGTREPVPDEASTAASEPLFEPQSAASLSSSSAPDSGSARSPRSDAPAPLNLIAELTYRCPLQCPYCSNPLDFRTRRDGLDAGAWGDVFAQAAELGVVHLGLTGGEPSTRSDLEAIVSHAVAADLYPHLVTAARPLTLERLDALAARGLRSVQVSLQAVDSATSERIAGTDALDAKLAIARRTRELGLALTLNCVLHRHNLEQVPRLIELSLELGADRLELANTQFHNWALKNRAALMPSREQLETAHDAVQKSKDRAAAQGLSVLFVMPDYYSGRPKPCMGGWGRLALVIDPTGLVLPCHEAADLPRLEFWRVPERRLADCWEAAPGMSAFRGTAWMPEPCRSCEYKERDFGGCRCQAFKLLGDAALTDPACSRSPAYERIVSARGERTDALVYRR